MSVTWPLPDDRVEGDPAFVTEMNQLANAVNVLHEEVEDFVANPTSYQSEQIASQITSMGAFRGAWSNSVAYPQNNIVTNSGSMYAANAATTAGEAPGVSGKWTLLPVADLSKTIVDAKGDLLVGTAADTVGRLPVGALGSQLFADSAQASGLRWGSAGELPVGQWLGTVNLNTVLTPGSYAVAAASTNLPVAAGSLLMVARQGGWIEQRILSTAGTRPMFVRLSVDTGASWGAWAEVRTSAASAGNTMTGTGSPEGVLTAPMGTEYTDTAATNGAVKWIKFTGSGNTGWRVTYGDTGWRIVASWTAGVQNASNQIGTLNTTDYTLAGDGSLRLRRVGEQIFFNLYSTNPSNYLTIKADNVYAELFTAPVLPTGFLLGAREATPPGIALDANGAYRTTVHAAGLWSSAQSFRLRATNTASLAQVGCLELAWPLYANEQWPTTLPGIAA